MIFKRVKKQKRTNDTVQSPTKREKFFTKSVVKKIIVFVAVVAVASGVGGYFKYRHDMKNDVTNFTARLLVIGDLQSLKQTEVVKNLKNGEVELRLTGRTLQIQQKALKLAKENEKYCPRKLKDEYTVFLQDLSAEAMGMGSAMGQVDVEWQELIKQCNSLSEKYNVEDKSIQDIRLQVGHNV